MIKYNKERVENVNKWNDDSIYILTDIDRKMRLGNSLSSWGVLSKTSLTSPKYAEDRNKLYNFYHPFEINEKLDYEEKNRLMVEWWNKHINLFTEYKLSESVIQFAANDKKLMAFRDGVQDLLENMNDRNIPVIIVSAGIGNFIKQFLINNNCNFNNIYILSNFIKFENGVAVGLSNEVIHSLNKNNISMNDNIRKVLKGRDNIILFGDSISDVKMANIEDRENALKIGFLNENVEENKIYFEKIYDVVCSKDTTYIDLFDKIKILKQ